MNTQVSTHVKNVVGRMERAVAAAGRHLLDAAASDRTLRASKKADQTIVLRLDVENQEKMLRILGDDLPVVAEEDEASHGYVDESEYLLVDPLDGTIACKRFLGVRDSQIGFGPIAGYVQAGRLVASVYYNVPHRTLFTAIKGVGVYSIRSELAGTSDFPEPWQRTRVELTQSVPLSEAALLFYTSPNAEARIVQRLREIDLIETAYRFGGFANDCSRLALGEEQIQLQFSVKPWDFPAVLMPAEAGLKVTVDPLGTPTPLEDWRPTHNNPILIAAPEHTDILVENCRKAMAS